MKQPSERFSSTSVRTWMIDYFQTSIDLPNDFTTSMRFDSYGIDSVEAVIMAGVMELEFGIQMEPRYFFNDPSIEGVITELLRHELIKEE